MMKNLFYRITTKLLIFLLVFRAKRDRWWRNTTFLGWGHIKKWSQLADLRERENIYLRQSIKEKDMEIKRVRTFAMTQYRKFKELERKMEPIDVLAGEVPRANPPATVENKQPVLALPAPQSPEIGTPVTELIEEKRVVRPNVYHQPPEYSDGWFGCEC